MADNSVMSFYEKVKKTAVSAVEATNPVAVLFGELTNTAPLEITVDQKFIIPEENIISTSILDSLTAGDSVAVLRMQGGQQYIVLDKVR